jgi:hypothetical protein
MRPRRMVDDTAFAGWDIVPAVRLAEVDSAVTVARIERVSSTAWTGQPDDCYSVSCDSGDLALAATLAYIVGMAARPR